MATLTIGISSSVVSGSKVYVGSDQDISSLLAWASSTLSGSLPSNPSNAQVLTGWANNVVSGTKAAIQDFQTVEAAPITLS